MNRPVELSGSTSVARSRAHKPRSCEDEDVRDEPQSDVPAWRIHDRTHLELPVGYPTPGGRVSHGWEVYFFAPESFRLDDSTYPEDEIYSDFKAYLRLWTRSSQLEQLSGAALDRLQEQLVAESPQAAREVRLFGCHARRSFVDGLRAIESMLEREPGEGGREPRASIELWTEGMVRVTRRLRELAIAYGSDGPVAETLRWIDEDLSLLTETLLGRLVMRLRQSPQGEESRALAALMVDCAVTEARYRRAAGYDSVVAGKLDHGEIERLEFRRHTLKRFASSALWLNVHVFKPGRWAEHVLFAFAASLAMAFAVLAALWNGQPARAQLPVWLGVAIVAYAIKDRLKAGLQTRFQRLVAHFYPDRRWRVVDQFGVVVGRVDETSRFVDFDDLPAEVLEARRMTRRHPIEEEARPETVLWHAKTVSLDGALIGDPFEGLLEVFRLDLSRWLTHTDDPKNRIMYADPERGKLATVTAPRVYNIAVVYRLNHGGTSTPWHRSRVVVSRKGIRRIDSIA